VTKHVNSIHSLSRDIEGTWWLLTREDQTKDGLKRIDPILGPDPIAMLVYANGYFAAQFMKRDRTAALFSDQTFSGQNNTSAVAGYDAYFGQYEIDSSTGMVKHTLIGSITPQNVGMTVQRLVKVVDGKLTITLETTTPENELITRTLTWRRIK
jgi:hypothetical protein